MPHCHGVIGHSSGTNDKDLVFGYYDPARFDKKALFPNLSFKISTGGCFLLLHTRLDLNRIDLVSLFQPLTTR